MPKTYKFTKTITFEGVRYKVRADTERELYTKMANKIRDLEEGVVKLTGDTTVKEWANKCVDTWKTNLKPISLSSYKAKMDRWIIREIGHMKVKDVLPVHCQNVMNNMTGYAKDTQRKVKQMLIFIFAKAKENHLTRENPALTVTLPIGTKTERRAITEGERTIILKVADTNPKYVYFLFMLFCGCRPSEVAEIKGMDIKKIKKQKVLHVRGTKTAAADRMVPIPDYLLARIGKTNPFDYMFKNEVGGQLNLNNRQLLWKHFKRDMNIALGCTVYRNEVKPPYRVAPDLVPYCLRHTYCTDLCDVGVDIRIAQYLMGHADIRMTANTYTHSREKNILKAANLLNGTPDGTPTDTGIAK